MFEIIMIVVWTMGIILGVMWCFLPWIIIAKIDEVIEELKKINSSATRAKEERHENRIDR